MNGGPRIRGCWADLGGLVHTYVALKTARGWFTVSTLCLSVEDMYLETLPRIDEVTTCLTCLCDLKNLLKDSVPL